MVVILLTEIFLPREAGWKVKEGTLPGDHAPAFPKNIMGLAMKRVDGWWPIQRWVSNLDLLSSVIEAEIVWVAVVGHED